MFGLPISGRGGGLPIADLQFDRLAAAKMIHERPEGDGNGPVGFAQFAGPLAAAKGNRLELYPVLDQP